MPAPRAASTKTKPRPAARRKPMEIECPACGAPVLVAPRELVEGREQRCTACGANPALTREWDDLTQAYHWILVDPLADFDDTHER